MKAGDHRDADELAQVVREYRPSEAAPDLCSLQLAVRRLAKDTLRLTKVNLLQLMKCVGFNTVVSFMSFSESSRKSNSQSNTLKILCLQDAVSRICTLVEVLVGLESLLDRANLEL